MGWSECEMKIVGQAPSGEMALLGDEMVAAFGDYLALVFFRLAVIAHDAAVAGCGEQKGSQIAEEIAEGKELVDDGVVVGNEMKDAARPGIGAPRQRHEQHVGSLPARTHGLERGQK